MKTREEQREYMRRYYLENPEKFRMYRSKHSAKYPETHRKAKLKQRFGITVEEYDSMVARQNGVCGICGGPQTTPNRRLHVDHDHETGVIRGLLCIRCNTRLGILEDTYWVEQARRYLDGC